MAKTPEAVYDLLDQLWQPALLRANKELEDLQSLVNKEGGNFKIASWDWWYYSEKLREEKYDLNDEELKEFFTLDNTIDGIFKTANKLFGLSFEERFDISSLYRFSLDKVGTQRSLANFLRVLQWFYLLTLKSY